MDPDYENAGQQNDCYRLMMGKRYVCLSRFVKESAAPRARRRDGQALADRSDGKTGQGSAFEGDGCGADRRLIRVEDHVLVLASDDLRIQVGKRGTGNSRLMR